MLYINLFYISILHASLHSVVDKIAAFHAAGRGSIPGWENKFNFDVFLLIPLTLRAKIPPFPRKNMEKNLTGWSLGTICLFKQKKFMVGHFEVGRYSHGRARDSVKGKNVLISTEFYYINHQLVVGDVFQKGSKSLPKFTSKNLKNRWLEGRCLAGVHF